MVKLRVNYYYIWPILFFFIVIVDTYKYPHSPEPFPTSTLSPPCPSLWPSPHCCLSLWVMQICFWWIHLLSSTPPPPLWQLLVIRFIKHRDNGHTSILRNGQSLCYHQQFAISPQIWAPIMARVYWYFSLRGEQLFGTWITPWFLSSQVCQVFWGLTVLMSFPPTQLFTSCRCYFVSRLAPPAAIFGAFQFWKWRRCFSFVCFPSFN